MSRVAVAFFLCVFGSALFFFLGLGFAPRWVEEREPPKLPEREIPLGSESAFSQVAELEPSAYGAGYQVGYRAYMVQTGQEVPPEVAVRYTSMVEGDSSGGSEDEMLRGYVDGYHKATEMSQCPRCY